MTSPWKSCDWISRLEGIQLLDALSDLWHKWRGEARAEIQREETGDEQAEVPANIDVDVEESPCKEGGSGVDGVLTGKIAAFPELVEVVDGNLTVGNKVVILGEGHAPLDGRLIDDADSSNRETEHSEDRHTVDESILPE